jgi:hypothetical protein
VNNEFDQLIKITNEDKILLLCARISKDPEHKEKIKELLDEDLNWDYLLQRAFQHKLMPLLYWNLKNLQKEVPEDVLQELKDYFNDNVHKNLLMTGELINILELLKVNNINAIPYKGPVLAELAYKNIALREFNDLDIFIFENDVIKTKKILKSQGYSLYPKKDPKPEFHYIKTQREYKFLNEVNRIMIEIHWKFQGISNNFIDQNSLDKIEINRRNILNFRYEDLLLILCTHCANHNWTNLLWMADISQIIETQNINWQTLLDKANKYEIRKILYINLSLNKYLFNTKIPNEVLNQLNSDFSIIDILFDILNRILENTDITLAKEAALQFKIRDNTIKGIQFCLWRTFSPTSLEWDSLYLPQILFPLYYIYRPIRLLIYGARYNRNNL